LDNLIADGGKFIADYRTKNVPLLAEAQKTESRRISHNYSITFLDTINWFHTSLAKLGDTVGLEKLSMPASDASAQDWEIYCSRDVDVLRLTFETFIRFIKEENFGNFAPTLAKQALNAYRHRFMPFEIQIHTKQSVIDLERLSYCGGRTECFFLGEETTETVYKLDINSQYPYVMRNGYFPCKLLGIRYWLDEDYFNHLPKNVTFIVDCVVETSVPCIPYRMANHLCFPVGTFRCALCEPEYRLALEEGCAITIKRVIYYESAPLFQQWVDEMYSLRKVYRAQGNEQYQYFCKLLMNSLYGKFGQRTDEWEPIAECDPLDNYVRNYIDMESGEEHNVKAIGGVLFEKRGWKEGFDTLVGIASFVTSYARAYLWKLICRAGIDNVYYCDTDSLFVNGQGLAKLIYRIDESELGYLKVEAKTDYLHIYNLKDYEFGTEIKIKGVSKKAIKLDGHTYLCEQWEHLSGALRKGHLETVMVHQQQKVLQREYKKGVIQPNGRVTPFELLNGQILDV